MVAWLKNILARLRAKEIRYGRMLYVPDLGKERTVDMVVCPKCTNHFWVEYLEQELPKMCPYCGHAFTGIRRVSDQEFNDLVDGH